MMYAKRCLVFLTMCALALVACGPVDGNNGNNGGTNNGGGNNGGDVTEVPGGTLSEDTTWSGTVILTGNITVESRLTIEPCTTVRVDSRFTVGEGGVLLAQGTEDCPITFTSIEDSPSPGDWRWINIGPNAGDGSVFEWVEVEYTGDANEYAIQLSDKTVTMNNVTIRDGIGTGIRFEDENSGSSLDNLTFENMTGYVMVAEWDNLAQIGSVTATGGELDRIELPGTGLDAPLTMDNKGVPYQNRATANISADLTIEAGTQILMSESSRIIVDSEGTITANGTEESPIVIESAADSPSSGDWQYVQLEDGPNTFTWTVFRHANEALRQNGDVAITLNNVTFEQNGCDYSIFTSNTEDKWTFNDTSGTECQ